MGANEMKKYSADEFEKISKTDKDILAFTKKADQLGYKIGNPYFFGIGYESLHMTVVSKGEDYLPYICISLKGVVNMEASSHGRLKTNEFLKFLNSQRKGYKMAKLIEKYIPLLPHFISEE